VLHNLVGVKMVGRWPGGERIVIGQPDLEI
jgi:hypothetical protein